MNLAYKLAPGLVSRVSYDQLFTEPPLSQGAILGQPILPQLTKQFQFDLEKQIAPRQTAKFTYYRKRDTNQIDVGLLVPYTQMGAYTAVSFQHGNIEGTELSYNLTPRNNQGVSAYLSWTNSLAKPTGLDNQGNPVPVYNDHDQLNTISTGTAYTWRSGASTGLDLYYGTGVASSVLSSVTGATRLDDGDRQPRSLLNWDIATSKNFFGHGHGAGVGCREFAEQHPGHQFQLGL